ncbi:MAG TPA: CBS domain-containing protein [Firmicutes bacterium]|uniref:CBS domain-containing protein n=1 Tax=Capillibacterium thermochitinicola TaxID=2699427 RepID=A0A8J6I1C5_9FIRM|nr:CBS and ACT domain-containing protein [Capillibacterium thermochitinicola]MBA2133468.1 CBS domain-containing protein [Capillibacterium thermochitinicola]HHW13253.1 CBS domain-containing protein [Bacillota bacterium]
MYVRNRMTVNPITVTPDTTIATALEIMREKKINRIPVVKDEKLVGIITERKLMEVSPSSATSLSIFEINYLLAKTKVEQVMTKKVVTVSPDDLLEVAALKMRDNSVGGLPVVENGKVVGIITESNIFDAFIEIMGFREKGSRISILIQEDRPGVLAELAQTVATCDINITHLAIYHGEIVLRVDTRQPDALIEKLKEKGFRITSVTVSA